jgi:aryl-phospho-beta-D-glucosidase BglC (GH1 family)
MRKSWLYAVFCSLGLILCFFLYVYFTFYHSDNDKKNNAMVITKGMDENVPAVTESTMTASQVVKAMKIGWNLGNTLDCCDSKKTGNVLHYETLWGNPVTSGQMIKQISDAGFGAIRVPVTWYDHLDENYIIDEAWLDRVEEVVQYILENEMYCIINLHHEEAWLNADSETEQQCEEHLETVWRQIGERFQGYGGKLLFEGFNEVLDENKNWTGTEALSYEIVNRLNQVFVNVIRQGAGFNKERCLIVNTYGASPDHDAVDNFRIPADSVENHLIVQVHTYIPLEFTWAQNEVFWTEARNNWNASKDKHEIDLIMERLNRKFVSNGVPVILGEFGAWDKNNTEERVKYVKYVVSSASQYGITCFWWDTGGDFKTQDDLKASALLNRIDLSWYYPEIVNALIEASKKEAD